MRVLILDGYNLMHRARSGFTKGEWPVVFNFFRSLRSLIEKFNPERCYFVLEGTPVRNLEMLPSYKGSRKVDPVAEPKKHADLVEFHRQKDRIIKIMMHDMPGIRVIWHDDYEADDVMAELALGRHAGDEVTIVSGDSDMIQVLQESDHVRVYHPIRKAFVKAPDYDYVTWKALCGDATDDISGLPRVGAKTAEKLARDPSLLEIRFAQNLEDRKIFLRNLELIRLHRIPGGTFFMHERKSIGGNWDNVRAEFEQMGFMSLLKHETWSRFKNTFKKMS